MIWGIFAGDAPAGWANWTVGDAPFASGWHTLFMTAMVVGFSFQGTELMGIAAGESENPGKNIPKAAHQIFWRILLFLYPLHSGDQPHHPVYGPAAA